LPCFTLYFGKNQENKYEQNDQNVYVSFEHQVVVVITSEIESPHIHRISHTVEPWLSDSKYDVNILM
jgi:hypothetical protein